MRAPLRNQHQVARREGDRRTGREFNPAGALNHQMKTGGLFKVGDGRRPGGRKVGAEIQNTLEVQGIENIVQYIHFAVRPNDIHIVPLARTTGIYIANPRSIGQSARGAQRLQN